MIGTISEMMVDCSSLNISILPINGRHLDKLKNLPYMHKDPFDRLLLAQAKSENYSLLTHDAKIDYYNEKCVMKV